MTSKSTGSWREIAWSLRERPSLPVKDAWSRPPWFCFQRGSFLFVYLGQACHCWMALLWWRSWNRNRNPVSKCTQKIMKKDEKGRAEKIAYKTTKVKHSLFSLNIVLGKDYVKHSFWIFRVGIYTRWMKCTKLTFDVMPGPPIYIPIS